MVEYLYTEGMSAEDSCPIKVRVHGVVVGQINKVLEGFQYVVRGGSFRYAVFGTLAEVQYDIKNAK